MTEMASPAPAGIEVTRTPIEFPSSKGDVTIHGYIWQPEGVAPKGIVQIVHGMVEFIERYDAYARDLAAAGYIVAGHDHVGHGDSVNSTEEWGRMPLENGARIWIEDTGLMRHLVEETFGRELPYFIQGHSMGSFITRAYIAERAAGLSGAIIEGTGNLPVMLSNIGCRIARSEAKKHGPDYLSDRIEGMALGGYAKAIDNARTPADWLSRDEAVVDRYLAEPRNTFRFSVAAYLALMTLTALTAKQETVNRVPKDLPVLIASGDKDPVGDNGKGPSKLYAMFNKAGAKDVTLKLYPGARHELHNETNRDEFIGDVVAWLDARI